ncbi:MAG TPA: guanine deaminase [Candidatus Saccharimonadales bacterium]|nr:guanine deaminase [Candidatus Saccharimonadales bacterium]
MKESHAIIRGALLYIADDPFLHPVNECLNYEPDGIIVIKNGIITECGAASEILKKLPKNVAYDTYSNKLIVPGFIDTHIHYVQTDIIGAFGKQLIDWLNTYTFVAEQRFHDPSEGRRVADFFCDELLRNGTTTALTFCAVYPESVNQLFEAASKRDMRMIAGKVMMDRNAPKGLQDTAQSSYQDSKALIQTWHEKGRNLYAITPRFAPTSTPEQLEAAGQLWREYPTTYIHSHLSENKDEMTWVKELFPKQTGYLDVYDHFGLTGKRAVYAHAVHITEAEMQRCFETNTTIAHCPTSNLFLGSGLFELERAKNPTRPLTVGLGTDIGAGTSFSMLQTMNEAYKVAQLRSFPLDAVRAFFLATLGGARALHLDDKLGTLEVGKEADFVVLDPYATPLLKERMQFAHSIEEQLFILMTLGDDRSVAATYVAGRKAYARE